MNTASSSSSAATRRAGDHGLGNDDLAHNGGKLVQLAQAHADEALLLALVLLGASAEFPYGLRVFFDEGCGMENLRAFMLVTSVQGFCADADFA